MGPFHLEETEALPVCTACGHQYPPPKDDGDALATCFICDDPRQYTPSGGQSFTTLRDIRSKHQNEFHPFPHDDRLVSIATTPKFGIGQRAILIRTPAGNILWDCVTLLDEDTVAKIKTLGGLSGIVISHPHYYSTHVDWATAFDCPVYISLEDVQWTTRTTDRRVLLDKIETTIEVDSVDTGIKAIKLGGHFPGSLVLLFDGRLLIADTLYTTPSGMANWTMNALGQPRQRPEGVNTFSFMWSIPNQIPLSADEIARMWGVLKDYDFTSTHGAFVGQDIEDSDIKSRVLQSMQIQIKHMGHEEHPFLHAIW